MKYQILSSVFAMLFVFSATSQPITTPAPPTLAAESYILMDFLSDTLIAEKDIDKKVEPASITKMMTAYVVFTELKNGNLRTDDLIRVSEKAWRTGGSKMFIEVNKTVSVSDLLKGMIIQSGNDACIAFAEHIAGTEETFTDLMNQYAKKLGMKNSHFTNSTGLPSEGHYITARDAAILAKAIIVDFPEYFPLFSEKEFTFNEITQHNRNTLLWRDPSVDGFKTGHTESAGYCLVSSAKRNGMRLIAVVMGTESQKARADESQNLLNYGFRFYETNLLFKANEKRVNVEVWKGVEEGVDLGLQEDLFITIPKGEYKNLQAKVDVPNFLIAPIGKSSTIGTLNINLHDKVISSKPLVALDAVNKGGWWTRTTDSIGLWFKDDD
ncbi:MAG TPA: D-alanyl-D-alanine carboxypeptidase family protein [Gammaproteobacteria bacterium]|nr:D-alanyl-D-alanine carboxypeptidase [Xanthomonadales bacterium]MCB1594287.1 D-alanyl-D-alanine carboxypeptidase [Xanthomonadales bacterium]HOP22167.1 D-alanyl-D-alanine carboxypeptidase family protein [Gammaproteobacteria bacterium]HPI95118.1 D-alanyl-D-alanine carboxypeptidase family protein [Gammaproteobacteria bacterium]HPQ86876.1 D-alanyl-D-alanine carboxypeptidase family protein [Gammaproteobacteria bacterium]